MTNSKDNNPHGLPELPDRNSDSTGGSDARGGWGAPGGWDAQDGAGAQPGSDAQDGAGAGLPDDVAAQQNQSSAQGAGIPDDAAAHPGLSDGATTPYGEEQPSVSNYPPLGSQQLGSQQLGSQQLGAQPGGAQPGRDQTYRLPRYDETPDYYMPASTTTQPEQPKGVNPMGVTALILALIAVATCWIPLAGVVAALPALVAIGFGIAGVTMRRYTGRRGLSIAGLVVGSLAFMTSLVLPFITGAFWLIDIFKDYDWQQFITDEPWPHATDELYEPDAPAESGAPAEPAPSPSPDELPDVSPTPDATAAPGATPAPTRP